MTAGKECSHTKISFGTEGAFDRIVYDGAVGTNCTDCGTPTNKPHHFGCDREKCPNCKSQVAFCDCGVVREVETF